MPRLKYQDIKFRDQRRLTVIKQADQILRAYAKDGDDLTLRQLYYQFIARDLFPSDWVDKKTGSKNCDANYDRLGDIIASGRLMGMIDWKHIVDRGRRLRSLSHWWGAAAIIQSASKWFNLDLWENQERRIECWVEKDALIGVLETVCTQNDVPYYSSRGYNSWTEIWEASQRVVKRWSEDGQPTTILYLSDHDPSGMDLTRDTKDKLEGLVGAHLNNEDVDDVLEVKRIALTQDQIDEYDPPPQPAKQSDARFIRYVNETGLDESWELDALEPSVMRELIQSEIDQLKDQKRWDKDTAEEVKIRKLLAKAADNWDKLEPVLTGESKIIKMKGKKKDDGESS